MSEVLRKNDVTITSSSSGAVVSEAFRVGGNLFDVQIKAPDVLASVEVSGDKLTWYTATDIAGTSLTALGTVWAAAVREGAEWVRFQVATDAGGPQPFNFRTLVHKQGGSG